MRVKFKILRVDQDEGMVEVQFINPYGPIESGEKQIEDFEQEVDVHTGNYHKDGSPEVRKETVLLDSNPNQDQIVAIGIPVKEDGRFCGKQELLNTIATYFPKGYFDEVNSRKKTKPNMELNALNDTLQDFDFDEQAMIEGTLYNEDEETPLDEPESSFNVVTVL